MDNGTCSMPGCERPVWVKRTGECSTCQSRRYRRENPGKGRTVYDLTCEACSIAYRSEDRASRFCSLQCKGDAYRVQVTKLPADHPVRTLMRFDPRGELRRGYEDGDADLFFAALVARADTSGECWLWPEVREGYPTAKFGRRRVMLHRIVLEVKHGAPLGSQAAHHACANSACVNPDHLQPVTHRDNVAEMLARHSYLRRIAELETALREMQSDHPLLAVIQVA